MRFLHLGDLHLGKRLKEVSLLEDQKAVLAWLARTAVERRVDGVLIAGDVYQKASPQGEAMTVFHRFVTALSEAGIRVFIISGNHDSDQRISYFSPLLRKAGVYVSDAFTGVLQPVEMEDAYGPLTVHLLPFVRPSAVRRCYPDEAVESTEDAVRLVLAHSPVDPARRNVLVAHQLVTGAATCDSEELTVGGLDDVDARLFDAFDYVALGHIHTAQRAGRDTCRYAGSPLKYSLSEARRPKSAALVELGEKGRVTVELLPIQPPHELRPVRGTMEELLSMPTSEDYVFVTATDELVPPDARVQVSAVFPNLLSFAVENSRTGGAGEADAREVDVSRSPVDLFCDFYRLQNNDQPMPEGHLAVLQAIVREMEEEAHEAP